MRQQAYPELYNSCTFCMLLAIFDHEMQFVLTSINLESKHCLSPSLNVTPNREVNMCKPLKLHLPVAYIHAYSAVCAWLTTSGFERNKKWLFCLTNQLIFNVPIPARQLRSLQSQRVREGAYICNVNSTAVYKTLFPCFHLIIPTCQIHNLSLSKHKTYNNIYVACLTKKTPRCSQQEWEERGVEKDEILQSINSIQWISKRVFHLNSEQKHIARAE